MAILEEYAKIVDPRQVQILQRFSERLAGRTFLHVNSTATGGGVAEILHRMLPLLHELGLQPRWAVMEAPPAFYETTKAFHNALQGQSGPLSPECYQCYLDVNRDNAARLDLEADFVLIHDPQPAALVETRRSGRWIWRCHVDVSHPNRVVWDFLKGFVERYDAAIFSAPQFAQSLRIPQFMISPSIDPFSDKNRELTETEINAVLDRHGIPRDKPILLQVSRFDRFKDPLGVIRVYRRVKRFHDCQLVLAGGPASDDPEGERVLEEVQEQAAGDPDIHILMLPPFSDLEINALQRAADIVLQKSLREGFGLTVTEAMWKGKPVVAGAVGGIPLQIQDGLTGYLVHSEEGAAYRIRQLLHRPEEALRIGRAAREHVRRHFLLIRHAQEYLLLLVLLEHPDMSVVYL